jgi:hypothetical protein
MDRLPRVIAFASLAAIALALGGCGFDTSRIDPTDLLDNVFADQKKPLQGDRKPMFPQGTPGVQQGVPPELVKGYQPPPEPPPPEDQPPAPKSKAKAKAQATAPPGAGAPYAN